MPNNQTPDFAEHVWNAAATVGLNAPRITDALLQREFPKTVSAALGEGATRMLRTGCISEVKRVLHTVRGQYPMSVIVAINVGGDHGV